MPSTSAKQHRFMEAVKHSPTFAKKVGVSQSVGQEFAAADDKTGITKSHNYDVGGEIGRLPTYGVSSSYDPPRDYRKQGPREYPK